MSTNKILFDDKKFLEMPMNNGNDVWKDNCGCLKGNFFYTSQESCVAEGREEFSKPSIKDLDILYGYIGSWLTEATTTTFYRDYNELVDILHKFEKSLVSHHSKLGFYTPDLLFIEQLKQDFVAELRRLDYIVFLSDTIETPALVQESLEAEQEVCNV